MTARNPLKSSTRAAPIMDAAKARDWARFALQMGHIEKAALWEAEAHRLSAEERGTVVDFKMRAAGDN